MNGAFDFDASPDRRGSDSLKWRKYEGRDVLPLWVADMDFASPPGVLAELRERVDHGVFGYGLPPRELVEVVLARLRDAYGWTVREEELVWLPGLVSGLSVACRALAGDGGAVLTTTPIYPPFLSCPRAMSCGLQTAPLAQDGERWVFDWERLEATVTPQTRALLLCSPHNPCGRIWERGELAQLAEFCARHRLVLVSDEIHCQLLLDDRPHVPTATLAPEVAARTVTLMAPSKTYNIPGLGCAFAVITDAELRRRFTLAASMIVPHVNVLGYAAALGAYRDGDDWLRALLAYLRGNRDQLAAVVADLPGLSMARVEATYLAWLDCRRLGAADPCAHFEQHGLGFACGREFQGEGFVRFNFGCTRAVLAEALGRLRRAVG
jgi:cysteine-S-conjugate beta-lyase